MATIPAKKGVTKLGQKLSSTTGMKRGKQSPVTNNKVANGMIGQKGTALKQGVAPQARGNAKTYMASADTKKDQKQLAVNKKAVKRGSSK